MTNHTISDFLRTYIENPDPRYAVMLKGKWGCGKSYFISKWVEAYQQPRDGCEGNEGTHEENKGADKRECQKLRHILSQSLQVKS